MRTTDCPNCGMDLSDADGPGAVIDVAETVRYHVRLTSEDGTVFAEGSTGDAMLTGPVTRVLCGECYGELDAVPTLDGQAV